ncbi:MAG TPA: LPS export ABC transporter periplasmic protein LptC [Chitinophagaceae bacterium]
MREVEKFARKDIGVEEGKQIESLLSNGGVLKARLTAPVFLRYQTQVPRIEFPKTLHVDFYDSTRNIESQLFAKYGEYKENENKVYLRDSVVIFNIKGDTLFTDELFWDQNTQLFFTDKPVVISQTKPQRQKIYGIGLSADQNLSWFTIKNLQPPSFTEVPDSTYL